MFDRIGDKEPNDYHTVICIRTKKLNNFPRRGGTPVSYLDEQTQKDANELAAILSRKNKCEYKVLIDLSCVAVIHDSKE